MGIDIYILNLPRSTHRLTLCREELCARGIPAEKIRTWVANDDWDYEKTRQVCEAAIADGFPKYQLCLDEGQHNQWNIANCAQSWNYCRFFRHLIDEQKTALLIQDDIGLGNEMTYEFLNEMVDFLQNRDEIFRYLTLWTFNKDKVKKDYAFVPENPHIIRGVHGLGCDMVQVITPEGAEFLLSKFEGYSPPRLDILILRDLNRDAGFYTINDKIAINCKEIINDSTVFNSNVTEGDKFLRPIKTTWDADPVHKNEDIDVYILNLPREEKRRYMTEGALRAKGVPPSKLHIWKANDDQDYEKTRQVCEAAITDGFPKFQSFLDTGQHNACNIAHLTQSWNWCRFFRHLIDEQKTAMLIQDDVMLGDQMTYRVLNEMVECLHDRNEIFYYFTLWIRWFGRRKKLNPELIPENPHIIHGIYSKGCDMAQVITPEGAELLLLRFEGYFYPVLEDLIFDNLDLKHHTGFYALSDEEPFSCQKWTRESTIRLEGVDGFVRPIEETKD